MFKTLFSKEPINLEDLSITFSVTTRLYLDLNENKEEEHVYKFIGRVGQFTPVKDGFGGGLLLRYKEPDKYSFTSGAKGYRWLETNTVSEMMKKMNCDIDDIVDIRYFNKLANDAIDSISNYGDFDLFVKGAEIYE